jgi:class 3 adenylate cyclase
MDLREWLRSLRLERYEPVFRENAIDADVIRDLTDEHLRELAIPMGARLKLLKAIAELGRDTELGNPAAGVPKPISQANIAERRQVTVMFCDLVGSTALSARMDPEDLREVIAAYQKCVTETVQRFDGYVAKYMGDGVLVYFGYPQAHEDDAERAVYAGLQLIPAVNALKSDTLFRAALALPPG